MELFQAKDHYILQQGERALWCSRRDGRLELRPADGTVGVDLCHHLLPASHGAVVAHFPERVVLNGLTLLELRACATLVELVTLLVLGLVVVAGLVRNAVPLGVGPHLQVIAPLAGASHPAVDDVLHRQEGGGPCPLPLDVDPIRHGAGAAVRPAGAAVLGDVLVAGDAGVVDPVHVAPVPALGQIRRGQVLVRPRVGPAPQGGQPVPARRPVAAPARAEGEPGPRAQQQHEQQQHEQQQQRPHRPRRRHGSAPVPQRCRFEPRTGSRAGQSLYSYFLLYIV
uniref:Inositol polyphosphate-5-phosphatase F n=1 Tax=Myotis myotis TaxID=51298 RepID=A0A7J7TTE9_MYOMY|nr:inositol polyphosphate-5-phosphatase F [Myotis myotis]